MQFTYFKVKQSAETTDATDLADLNKNVMKRNWKLKYNK